MNLLKNINIPPKVQVALMTALFAVVGLGLISAVGIKMNSETDGIDIHIASTEYGSSMISQQDIQEFIDAEMPQLIQSATVKHLDLRKLEKILNGHEQVYKADVFINRLNKIVVKVYQKEPIFRIYGNGEQSYYLDRRGERVPLSTYYTARMPVVQVQGEQVEEELHTRLLELKNGLKLNPFIDKMVDQVIIDEAGSITLIPMMGEFQIKVGTIDKLDEKLNRLARIYKEKIVHKGWDYYKVLDLRFDGQVVAQKKRHE